VRFVPQIGTATDECEKFQTRGEIVQQLHRNGMQRM